MYTVGKTKCLELKYFVNTAEECGLPLFGALKIFDLSCVCVGERVKLSDTEKD